jgi:hypothetical protein
LTQPEDTQLSLRAYLEETHLVTELRRSLQDSIFSDRLCVSPRGVNQVAEKIAATVLQFGERKQEEEVRAYGEQLAREGIGHCAILALTESLRRMCWEASPSGSALHILVGRYVFSLLEGYMAGREAYLLEEQSRTYRALERAREQNGV